MSNRTDPRWCFENPDAAAADIDDLEAERDALASELRSHKAAIEGLQAERDALAADVSRLEDAIKFQASAAKRGMNAAKEHGAHMEADAKRLYAQCNSDALESERQANAQLTEENAALAAHLERIQDARIGLVPSALCPVLAEAIDSAPTTSLARLKAEGAALVAEKAWQRTDWDSIGNSPKEWAANHATLVGNEMRRQTESVSRET